MDLVDPEDWSVPDPSRFKQEPVASQGQEDEVNDAFSDLEAELDLVGSDESCIPVPSVSEMKA